LYNQSISFFSSLRALDAWFAYLCTRESILRKHYSNSSLFVAALANANVREIVDSLLYILNPLAFCPFHLDLLYQYRQLQNSFGNMNNHTVNVSKSILLDFFCVYTRARAYTHTHTSLRAFI